MRRPILLGSGVLVALLVLAIAGFPFIFFNNLPPEIFTETPLPAQQGLPQVVAVVNGETITRDMVESELKISRLNVIDPLPPLTGEDYDRAVEEAVNQLVNRHLILQAAARQNFALDDAFVEDRADLLFGSTGAEALQTALEQSNATRDELLWWVREIFTVEKFMTDVVMAGAAPAERQNVYNNWLNTRRAEAEIKIYLNGEEQTLLALVGEPAPDFTLTTPDGRPVSLSDYTGKVVLVNFWATWCSSCVTEMPDYEQVYQQYGRGERDFVVLGINFQESAAQVQQYANGLGVTFPVLVDQSGSVTNRQYQVTAMPASLIIDKRGLIFYRHLGPMSGETLTAKLKELGL